MKKIFFYCLSLLAFSQISAQTTSDILRYSRLQTGNGTARSVGVGGALGALGADYSAIANNPAGLASFRTSEFVLTPGFYNADTRTKLEGSAENVGQSEKARKFILSNIGFVGSRRPTRGKWTTKNWAIGLNNQTTFNGGFFYEGTSVGSIVQRFQENASFKESKGDGFSQFEEQLGIEAGAVYKSTQTAEGYTSDFDGKQRDAAIFRSQESTTEGRVRDLNFAYAANYKEKLQIGASISVPFVSFYENKVYQESDDESADGKQVGNVPYFKSLSFAENLSQTGTGINAKLGLIFKPTQRLRLGAALQTGTNYKINETFNTSFRYVYYDASGKNDTEVASPDGNFSYTMITPSKVTASAAYLFGKKGFISADMDFIDYSAMSFQSDTDKSFISDLNKSITNTYRATSNLRIGGEFAMDIFRFRAGFATLGFPTKEFDNKSYFDTATKIYSAGIGLRENRFYADLGYQVMQSNVTDKPYIVSSDYTQPTVSRSDRNSQLVLTLGFKF
jgi:hypothetical protein